MVSVQINIWQFSFRSIQGASFRNFSLDLLNLKTAVLEMLGIEPILFMASNKWFRSVLIVTDVWKGFGYGAIIYLAALSGIDPGLYEAAAIDGANRFKRVWHITLPGILPTIMLVTIMNLPNVLNVPLGYLSYWIMNFFTWATQWIGTLVQMVM